jgi:predicted lipoprotein with Yx(FWY)xxD motif
VTKQQEEVMRHPRTTIAIIAVVAAAGVSGIAAAATAGGSTATAASSKAASAAAVPPAPSVVSTTDATIQTVSATVGGKTETVLVDAQGLPLYFYKPDTATKSFVSAGLASFWPPLVSTNPTAAGATGRLSVTHDANGAQVAYKGHFLYTFVSDSAGQVTGQGVQDFFVATPGIAAIGAGSSASTTPAPASGSSGIYGY